MLELISRTLLVLLNNTILFIEVYNYVFDFIIHRDVL